jgi:DNA-directed RNA polymerase specialized sigma subunit
MDISKVEAMLERYPTIGQEIQQIVKDLEDACNDYDKIETIKATQYSGLPHGTDISDIVTEILAIREKAKKDMERIRERFERITNEKMVVEEGLDKLTSKEREYVNLRYFELRKVIDISRKMNYDQRQLQRIKESALKKF